MWFEINLYDKFIFLFGACWIKEGFCLYFVFVEKEMYSCLPL